MTVVAPSTQDLKKRRRVVCEGKSVSSKLGEIPWVPNELWPIPSRLFAFFFHAFVNWQRSGSALVVHKDSPKSQRWNELKETNPLLRKMVELRQQYDESENPVVSSVRNVTETIGSWFEENETAQVTRLMKFMDPTFTREGFERELREYIVPEVVDAYLSADQESLRAWCGEAVSIFLTAEITSNTVTDLQCALGNNGALPQAGFDQQQQSP